MSLALDTGATGSVINQGRLIQLGYELFTYPDRHQISTGSGVEFVPKLPVARIVALGHERKDFPILAHTLPPTVSVDGLLGLDFLRGLTLNIDFRAGLLSLD
jgi:predicted aspartyl protease